MRTILPPSTSMASTARITPARWNSQPSPPLTPIGTHRNDERSGERHDGNDCQLDDGQLRRLALAVRVAEGQERPELAIDRLLVADDEVIQPVAGAELLDLHEPLAPPLLPQPYVAADRVL